MTDKEAIGLVMKTFEQIEKSKTIADLKYIPTENRISNDSYPQIEFKITADEIELLIKNEILDKEHRFVKDITSKLIDPLVKLLYATAWKNGDLKKIRHIIKGILEVSAENNEHNEALVFYQFGKYLTKTPGQPLIDQHVIRTFAVYKTVDKVTELRKLEKLNKANKKYVDEYKKWLISDDLTAQLKKEPDYSYHIDKLLFAVGKKIKLRNPRK